MRAHTGATAIIASHSPDLAASAAASGHDHVMRAMAAVLARRRPASTADALRILRRDYADVPLAVRIAALCSTAA
jgi:hypothetical protein